MSISAAAVTAIWPGLFCLAVFFALLLVFWLSHAAVRCFYFDPNDFAGYENGGGRELPIAASETTFEPLLKDYLDVTKLLITVAAASIAFAGSGATVKLAVPKVMPAFSILYGVMFCALLQFFYDEYT